MILKPIYSEDADELSFRTSVGSISDTKNEMIIHDVEPFQSATHNYTMDMFGQATQTIECMVKGFPEDDNSNSFMTAPQNRKSYIKRVYYYDIHMSSAYKTFEERFKHAALTLNRATAIGFTDAKLIPDSLPMYDYGQTPVGRITPFSLTVCTPSTNLLSTVANVNSELSNIRLDICSPLNLVTQQLSRMKEFLCSSMDVTYRGIDFLSKGITPSFKYIEQRVSDVEREKRNRQIRSMLPGVDATDTDALENMYKYIDLSVAAANLIVDMTCPYVLSMLKEYTLVYRTGFKSGFRTAVSPLDKILTGFTAPEMEYVRAEFMKRCRKLEDRFKEPIEIKLFTTSFESICSIKLLKSNVEETKRMTISSSLAEYIEQSIYNDGGLDKFKHDNGFDTIDMYGYQKNGYAYNHYSRGL